MFWGSKKFHINGRVQPQNTWDVVYHLLPFLGPGQRNTFRPCVLHPPKIGWESPVSALVAIETWGEGRAGLGHVTSTSLSAPAPAPGELAMHRRRQKTWVECWLCLLTPCVTLGKLLNVSGSQFQYRVTVRIK